MPTEITITDPEGKAVFTKQIFEADDGNAYTAYSANAIGEGRLVYGHFGRYSDFVELTKYAKTKPI